MNAQNLTNDELDLQLDAAIRSGDTALEDTLFAERRRRITIAQLTILEEDEMLDPQDGARRYMTRYGAVVEVGAVRYNATRTRAAVVVVTKSTGYKRVVMIRYSDDPRGFQVDHKRGDFNAAAVRQFLRN